MRKMILAIVPQDEAELLLNTLIRAGYTTTFIRSRGGMLRQAQQMLFTAVAEEDMERALTLIHDHCRTPVQAEAAQAEQKHSTNNIPVTTQLGGAIVFVWDLDRFEVY